MLNLWDYSRWPRVLYPVAGLPYRRGTSTRWNKRPCPAALEHAASAKQAIGNNGMDVRVPSGIISECLNGHHRTADAIIKTKGRAKEGEQAVCCACGQPGKQTPIIEKKFTNNDGDTEDILPMWNRVEDIFPKYLAKLDDFLRMAAWTEPAAPAGKGEQVLVMAVRATDTGEALF